jgi:hypothetical protein
MRVLPQGCRPGLSILRRMLAVRGDINGFLQKKIRYQEAW